MSMPNNSPIEEASGESEGRPLPKTYSAPSAKFIPQLDGVRGLAILGVMASHLMAYVITARHSRAAQLFSLGNVGVDLFFVLSGFLITGILVDTRTNSKFLLNFYGRRGLRIWPLYYSYLLLAFTVVPYVRPDLAAQIAQPYLWVPFIFFLQNFFRVPHFGFLFLEITWSVAIEEQFYLIWPILVRYCKMRSFTIFLLAVLSVEPVLRFCMLRLGMGDSASIYINVFCRLDGLAAGSLLAIYIRSAYFDAARLLRFCWLAIPLGGLGFAAAVHSPSLRYSFPPLAFAGFLGAAIYSRSIWLQKLLQCQPLLYTGRISYGLYLLHLVAFMWVRGIFSRWPPGVSYSATKELAFICTATAAAYLMATLSWYALERPVLSLKNHFGGRPPRVP